MSLSQPFEKPVKLTPVQRQRRLIQATNAYMAGKITQDEFRLAEQRYMVDYNALALELGRVSRLPRELFKKIAAKIQSF